MKVSKNPLGLLKRSGTPQTIMPLTESCNSEKVRSLDHILLNMQGMVQFEIQEMGQFGNRLVFSLYVGYIRA